MADGWPQIAESFNSWEEEKTSWIGAHFYPANTLNSSTHAAVMSWSLPWDWCMMGAFLHEKYQSMSWYCNSSLFSFVFNLIILAWYLALEEVGGRGEAVWGVDAIAVAIRQRNWLFTSCHGNWVDAKHFIFNSVIYKKYPCSTVHLFLFKPKTINQKLKCDQCRQRFDIRYYIIWI